MALVSTWPATTHVDTSAELSRKRSNGSAVSAASGSTGRYHSHAARLRILHPLPEQPELRPRDAAEHHEYQHGKRAGRTELRELPRRLVHPVDHHVRRVQRTAAGQHVDV